LENISKKLLFKNIHSLSGVDLFKQKNPLDIITKGFFNKVHCLITIKAKKYIEKTIFSISLNSLISD